MNREIGPEELSALDARANAAELDLAALRADLRDYIAWLEEPTRGPVIFRSEVVEGLSAILAP